MSDRDLSTKPIHIPKYFDLNTARKFYSEIQSYAYSRLDLSFQNCVWADHAELQRFAIFLSNEAQRFNNILISLPDPEKHTQNSDIEGAQSRVFEVIDYANRIHFFHFLEQVLAGKLIFECGGKSLAPLDSESVSRLIRKDRSKREYA